ncbi:MAG TPA: hypothetical protein VMV33_15740 [Rhodocyclaceae bacterium]|nr:hypothetical protein [Rhodocyclaceae bacterium]
MSKANLHRAFSAALLLGVLGLTGCGGGGAGGTAAAGSGAGTGTTSTATISVALTDPTTGAARTSITLGNPAKASATVVDAAGKPVASTVVSFATTPAGLVTMTPATGTALTDASGVAAIQIDPASLASAGAATITATAAVGTATPSGSASFGIGAAAVGLSALSLGQNPLSAYGTTSVSVNVTGVPTTTPVTVNFSSICATSGKATLPASVQSVNGVATATYQDKGCSAVDTITASIAGTAVTQTASLTVAAPGVASIQFVSATPTTIVLKGTGGAGLSESSIVVFKVVDNNSNPIANANVALDLTTRSGGILLDASSGPVTKQTGADGQVQVSVQAGSNPTPVWVTASVSSGGNTFSTQSTVLQISTGRPAQDRFSLSIKSFNIEGWNYDGVTTQVIAILSDRLGNPVPDGTAVNFIAEGGQIQPTCTTTGGTCSVNFTSANPRPTGDTEPSGRVTAGRVTVLAYALGEESFTDLNGNNSYDSGEPYNDLGDAFLDNNENNVWNSGEQFIPFNVANTSACVTGIANSPAAPSKANSCDGKWGAAHVRQDGVIVLSGSHANVSTSSFSMGGLCTKSFNFYLYDDNGNPMPSGTSLATTNLSTNLASIVPLPATVPNSNAAGGTAHSITVTAQLPGGGTCVAPMSGNASATLNITTPKGVSTYIPVTFTP